MLSGLGFDDVPRPGRELMARDAERFAAAEASAARGEAVAPSLVWYAWDRPTVTVGRLQDPARALDTAACAAAGIPVAVRPTGGRAVFHVDEWTYGAVVPLEHPRLGGGLAASCHALVTLIAGALAAAYGLPVGPSAATGGGSPGSPFGAAGWGNGSAADAASLHEACFGAAFGYELVVAGRKLMGSAQRRGHFVLLQQGSLLVGPGHERLARYLRDGGNAALEAALARRTVSLMELEGRRPDPGPFRRALAAAWDRVA